MDTSKLTLYGAKLKPLDLKKVLEHVFERNDSLEGRGTPVCIWGTHGLGKTHISQEFAKERGWKIAYVAPAQFEEMGDLHGMPHKVDPTPDAPDSGDEYTVFYPPDWVPTEEGPGILLLDDFNRADDRILRGLMQLLQNFELQSWTLPPKWQIVATANPEGGDYSVTPLDDAMLTRMLHVSLVFDPKHWARWADAAGVDKRGIAFVLNHPETVTGKRTTPRTLVQFFEQIQHIEDLKKEEELVRIIGLGALDEVTVAAFCSFVSDDLTSLIDPEEILNADSFPEIEKQIESLGRDEQGNRRIDRLSTICTRLFIHLLSEGYSPASSHRGNLVAFLLSEQIPNDLRAGLSMDLSNEGSDEVRGMMRSDPRLSKLLLKSM